MKKKNTKAMITRILACVLLVATLGLSLASCAAKDKVKDAAGKVWDTAVDGAEKIYDAAKDKITAEQTDGFGEIALLSLAGGTETVDEKDVMYEIIQATVLPDSATDKSTTWEAYWIDNQTGSEDAAVTDYVTVMPCTAAAPYTEQSGSNYCKVTCKQPFADSTIGVRVTTVVGGFTAECKVTYEGKPIYLGFHEALSDGSYQHVTDRLTLVTGTTYTFELALDNVFHSVGADFGTFEIKEITIEGTIKVERCQYNTSKQWVQETIDEYDISSYASKFVSATIKDGVLSVNVENAFESFIGNSKGGPSSGEYDRFAGYNDNGKPCIAVTVRDTVSGVENTLRFDIESSVESVSLSDSALTF